MRADMKMDSHQRRTDRAKIDFTKLNCTNSELQKCMNNELQKCVNNEFQKCVNSELQNDIRQL